MLLIFSCFWSWCKCQSSEQKVLKAQSYVGCSIKTMLLHCCCVLRADTGVVPAWEQGQRATLAPSKLDWHRGVSGWTEGGTGWGWVGQRACSPGEEGGLGMHPLGHIQGPRHVRPRFWAHAQLGSAPAIYVPLHQGVCLLQHNIGLGCRLNTLPVSLSYYSWVQVLWKTPPPNHTFSLGGRPDFQVRLGIISSFWFQRLIWQQ